MTGNESYLAGAILIDAASVLPVIQGLVKPDDFQIEAYRTVFTAAASLAADGEPVDPVSIQARARKQGVDLSNQLLTELMEVVPTCTNAADYAHRVAEDARVRQIKDGFRRTAFPALTNCWRHYSGKPRTSGAAAIGGGCSAPPTPSTGSTIWSLKQEKGGTILSPQAFPALTRFWAAVLSGLACTFWGRVRQWANPPLPSIWRTISAETFCLCRWKCRRSS